MQVNWQVSKKISGEKNQHGVALPYIHVKIVPFLINDIFSKFKVQKRKHVIIHFSYSQTWFPWAIIIT